MDPGGVPPPGGAENHRESPKAMAGWGMGIPPDIGCTKGGGDQIVGGMHWMEAEMVAQLITTRTVMEICREGERRPGARVTNRWWEHDGL